MKKSEKTQFGAILVIGFFFRLFSAWQKDFWLDEAISWAFARQSPDQMLAATAADNHPPLYYLFLHFWQKLSQTELFLRLPSIVFGVTSIFLIYQIARKLSNQKVALTSSLIFALSPLHIYFSAETRMYTLWTMLTLAGFYFFLKILTHPRKIYYLIFNILFLISLYTHYSTIFFILSLNIYLFLKRKKYKKKFVYLLISQIVIAIFFLPWALYIFRQPHPRPWSTSPLIGIPATFLSFTLGGMGNITLKTYFTDSVPFLIKAIFIFSATFFGFLFLSGLNNQGKKEEGNLLSMIIFLPIILVALISFFYPLYSLRHFLIISPYFYILVAAALEKLGRKWLKILAAAFLLVIVFIQNFYPPFKPQILKEAVKFIKENSLFPPIIVHTDILTFYPFSYYFQEGATQLHVFPSELTTKTTDIIGGSPVSFSEVIEKNKPFWSVHFAWDEKTWKFKKEYLPIKNFQSKKVNTINDLEIFLSTPGVE